jgi:hemoglobin
MATSREIRALPITPVEKGAEVAFHNPPRAFYDAVGGEEGMRELRYDFKDKIDETTTAHFIPHDEKELEKVKVKNSKFFIQICGGPKVYEDEAKGMDLNEYMIRVHDDFSINESARIEWLGTMCEALAEKAQHVPLQLIEEFWEYLERFSKLTVNHFNDGSTFYASYTQALEEKAGN